MGENITTVSAELPRFSSLRRSAKIFFSLALPQAPPTEVSSKNLSFCILPVFHLSRARTPFQIEPLRSKSNKLEQWQSTRNIYSTRWKRIPWKDHDINWLTALTFCFCFKKLFFYHLNGHSVDQTIIFNIIALQTEISWIFLEKREKKSDFQTIYSVLFLEDY